QADAGVAGGAFDDDAARLQEAAFLRVLDDVERGAVLDRAAGVQELGFAENRAAGHLRGAAQLDQRRVADRADKSVADIHASPPNRGAPAFKTLRYYRTESTAGQGRRGGF